MAYWLKTRNYLLDKAYTAFKSTYLIAKKFSLFPFISFCQRTSSAWQHSHLFFNKFNSTHCVLCSPHSCRLQMAQHGSKWFSLFLSVSKVCFLLSTFFSAPVGLVQGPQKKQCPIFPDGFQG